MPRTLSVLKIAKTWALSTYSCCTPPKFVGPRGERFCQCVTNLKQKLLPSFWKIILLSIKSDLLILLMCLHSSTRFNNYFPQKHEDNPWIRDPFGINMESITLPSNKKNQLVKLSCDQTLKNKFGEVSLSQFWCHDANFEYPSLAPRAIKIILPFSTISV